MGLCCVLEIISPIFGYKFLLRIIQLWGVTKVYSVPASWICGGNELPLWLATSYTEAYGNVTLVALKKKFLKHSLPNCHQVPHIPVAFVDTAYRVRDVVALSHGGRPCRDSLDLGQSLNLLQSPRLQLSRETSGCIFLHHEA